MDLHVSRAGRPGASGAEDDPLASIQAAAELAQPGDTVVVHEGVYRELVVPVRGGTSDASRITYTAHPGEKVTITGSDHFDTWVRVTADVWEVRIPNSYWGGFNPYAELVGGDWFDGLGRDHHLGMVLVDGHWIPEAMSRAAVMAAGENTWFAEVDPDESGFTTITAFISVVDPNGPRVEVVVRPSVFSPAGPGVDFITVRGFELRNAATNWVSPSSGQWGLVSAHWCRGWVIEDNEICYSRCAGIALGKYSDEYDGKRGSTEGYYDTIGDALADGWSFDRVGSHRVQDNRIHHCGQVAVVGSLGAIGSVIERNEIFEINNQGIWDGAEMAGIKLHAAVDVTISENSISHVGGYAGVWLDWMAQGTRVLANLFQHNSRDLFIEVSHGPTLVANNVFLSDIALRIFATGVTCAHNLVSGTVEVISDERVTPYLVPHGTDIAGWSDSVQLGDSHWLNNIYGRTQLNQYNPVADGWACIMRGNVFTKGSWPSRFETQRVAAEGFDLGAVVSRRDGAVYLTCARFDEWRQDHELVSSATLPPARTSGQGLDGRDGAELVLDHDYWGVPRDPVHPFPGPFESMHDNEVQVWPRPRRRSTDTA